MKSTDEYCLALTSCDDIDIANNIAETLVSSGLAACVNLLTGVQSVYQWQKQLQSENEIILLIKTRKELIEELENTLLKMHSYELPELITVPIESGSKLYIDWLSENLK